MNEPKWTPGPWWAEDGRVNAGKECVLVSHSFDYEGKRAAEERANLQVAAAAPDLYAALEDMLWPIAAGCQKPVARCRCATCVEDRARTALAKARGEA